MIVQSVLWLALLLFPVSEIAVALFKRGSPTAAVDDHGSMRLLWLVSTLGVLLASAISGYRATSLPVTATVQELAAASPLFGGLVLRWAAIPTLGRFFTANVAIHENQMVIAAGPYQHVRHPSYAGLLLAFFGLGVFFGNWLSLVVLMIPTTLVVIHRIGLEESVLLSALGPAYNAYRARTKRLIPGFF